MTNTHTAQRVDNLPSSLLLGFTGPAGAGKDTCAHILQAYGFRCIAFADELRRQVAEAWRIDPRMLTDRATKEWDIPALAIANCSDGNFVVRMHTLNEDAQAPRSPRWIMQRWGTEYRRHFEGDTYWIGFVERWVQRQRGISCKRLVITDVRFENEAKFVQRLGGWQITVHRPDLKPLAHTSSQHVSERLFKLPHAHAVHNDGDFGHLHAELLRVLGNLR